MAQAPKKKSKARRSKKTEPKSFFRRKLLVPLIVALSVTTIAGSGYGYYRYQALYKGMPELPSKETLWSVRREPAIEFLDESGKTLAIRGARHGRRARLSEMPEHVPAAFIAAEDRRFYDHDGADTSAIMRAAWTNFTSDRVVSGASTITQQLIKNLVLTNESSLRRKAQEIRLARRLEKRIGKDEILELYLNRIYFGSGAYGIDAAAREYFSKSPAELTLAEASLLAALPKAPSRLALDTNLEGAKERQAYVLREMVENGAITQAEADAARAEDISLVPSNPEPSHLGYVFDFAKEEIARLLTDPPGDLLVTLTIDDELQKAASDIVTNRLEKDGESLNVGEAAAIIYDLDGQIRVMIGGRNYSASQYNRATQAKRQPGSSFKAFLFAAALQSGLDPYDVRFDMEVTFGDWTPKNYSPGFYGPTTLSEAFARSLNTVAAGLGQEIGLARVISLANRFGVQSELKAFPSLALGSQELSLFELTRAYAPFAQGGDRLDPFLVAKIEDSRGNILYERPEYEALNVYPADLAGQMTGLMSRVVKDGTGGRAAVPGWSVAGKTGTSQGWRDALFIGFTSEYLGGVWVGNDDDTPMAQVNGGGLPAELWSDIMKRAHVGLSPQRLAGEETYIKLTPEAEARLTFYRGLANSFRGAEERGKTGP